MLVYMIGIGDTMVSEITILFMLLSLVMVLIQTLPVYTTKMVLSIYLVTTPIWTTMKH